MDKRVLVLDSALLLVPSLFIFVGVASDEKSIAPVHSGEWRDMFTIVK